MTLKGQARAKSVYHTLMREARYPKYDYIPHNENLLKNVIRINPIY
jgi:hypothetical protein